MQSFAQSHLVIGRNLRRWRQSHRLTQDALAHTLELQRPAVSQIEAGSRKLTVAELVALTQTYGLTYRRLARDVPIVPLTSQG